MRKSNGISLIVLVITIIVIIILAGAVILSLSNNNSISKASEAKFKSNASEYKSELTLFKSNKYMENSTFQSSTLNAVVWNGLEANITGTVKEYIKSITAEDGANFAIQSGKLVYVGTDTIQQNLIVEIGIAKGIGLGINVIASVNSTVNAGVAAYSNPIIPKGFKAINTTTSWPTDWDKGLVIEDVIGNQFVWVPVYGTTVPYAKWCTKNISYTTTTDDTLPTGITSETDQITKYGGFYIARYEAGNAAATLVSKKNATVWNNINYTNSKLKAESMYNTAEVKSGLVTGRQGDTTLKWLENSGKNVTTDSRSWGNFSDSISPANVSGYGFMQVTGFSENWKANNIYDLAGNTWEWRNEMLGSQRIDSGTCFQESGSSYPVAFRYSAVTTYSFHSVSFRVALYIL